MDYTKSKGNITELTCISKFMEYGFDCSLPYGDSAKYDFIADVNGKLLRIQCKSAKKVDENSIVFSTYSQTTNTKKTVRHCYTSEQIDYFATSYNSKVYIVPVDECSTCKTLRFAPPQNGNINYNKAEEYEFETIFEKDIDPSFKDNGFEKLVTKIDKKLYYCINCKKTTVSGEDRMCINCARLSSRVVERPTREVLKTLIREKPFTQIAKEYGVSDRAICKWCKTERLPYRKREIRCFTDEEWSKI